MKPRCGVADGRADRRFHQRAFFIVCIQRTHNSRDQLRRTLVGLMGYQSGESVDGSRVAARGQPLYFGDASHAPDARHQRSRDHPASHGAGISSAATILTRSSRGLLLGMRNPRSFSELLSRNAPPAVPVAPPTRSVPPDGGRVRSFVGQIAADVTNQSVRHRAAFIKQLHHDPDRARPSASHAARSDATPRSTAATLPTACSAPQTADSRRGSLCCKSTLQHPPPPACSRQLFQAQRIDVTGVSMARQGTPVRNSAILDRAEELFRTGNSVSRRSFLAMPKSTNYNVLKEHSAV